MIRAYNPVRKLLQCSLGTDLRNGGWCQENILKGPTWLWGVRVKVREPHGS